MEGKEKKRKNEKTKISTVNCILFYLFVEGSTKDLIIVHIGKYHKILNKITYIS